MQKNQSKELLVPNVSTPINPGEKLLIFDLSVRGHHPGYIQHLIEYWQSHKIPKMLNIVVSPQFLKEHSDVVKFAQSGEREDIDFIPITTEEAQSLNSYQSKFKRVLRHFQEWHLLCKYAHQLRADHCLIMYFDKCQLPLALGAKPPCSFSGIYFRPTFHYHQLTHYNPTWQDRIQQWRERITISRVLAHPKLQGLFCLDPLAVPHLNEFQHQGKAKHLPDPVKPVEPSRALLNCCRDRAKIDPSRRVFLLFGSLTRRKGIYQLLDAIYTLSLEWCQKLCLLLVGESSIADQLDSKIAEICQARPVQIIQHYQFIPEAEIPAYFQLCDVVLAPYQRHVGMSGILILAAAFNKPVLCSNYGLMGEMVQRYQLGLTVDSMRPEEIAAGLSQFLQIPNVSDLCDPIAMMNFAQQNSAEEFARIIFEHIELTKNNS
mgnify:CR=1 FL=1